MSARVLPFAAASVAPRVFLRPTGHAFLQMVLRRRDGTEQLLAPYHDPATAERHVAIINGAIQEARQS